MRRSVGFAAMNRAEFAARGTAMELDGDPFAVANGDVVEITAAYSGVTGGEYRGLVEYSDGTDILSSTVVYLTRP